ncbi:30S ribosomal protein S9 [Candidatus Uhrbacteria bacterium]|nr:30S ribosomal protein S9 [Candidatus Uhrbacteria bacterium]
MTSKDTHVENEPTKKQKTKSESKTFVARAVGRRKEAIARVSLSEGIGKIIVNGKDYTHYFPTFALQKNVQAPLVLTDTAAGFDVSVKVVGGGVRGQADAVRHGISRALLSLNNDLKKTLRAEGFLTRDPRVKERKKPGLKRARRAPQFSKR